MKHQYNIKVMINIDRIWGHLWTQAHSQVDYVIKDIIRNQLRDEVWLMTQLKLN